MNKLTWVAVVFAAVFAVSPCRADTTVTYGSDTYTFSALAPADSATLAGSSGSLSASASFTLGTFTDIGATTTSYTVLAVTLTNTSTANVGGGSDVLTGLSFKIPTSSISTLSDPNGALFVSGTAFNTTAAAAKTTFANTSSLHSGTPTPLNPANGWANNLPAGGTDILSATGQYGAAGTSNFLNGPSPTMLDGSNYGIVPSSVSLSSLSNQGPQVVGSLTFYLTVTSGTAWSAISNTLDGTNGAVFLYGTGSGEPTFPFTSTPVPSSLVMLGSLLVPSLGFFWYRRRNAAFAA